MHYNYCTLTYIYVVLKLNCETAPSRCLGCDLMGIILSPKRFSIIIRDAHCIFKMYSASGLSYMVSMSAQTLAQRRIYSSSRNGASDAVRFPVLRSDHSMSDELV